MEFEDGQHRGRYRSESVPAHAVEDIHENLRGLRAKKAELDIHGVEDTSLCWSHLRIEFADESGAWDYSLPLRLSGFYGSDAALLDSLLNILLGSILPKDCRILTRLSAAEP
jgi:hypothetical protein